MSKRRKEVFDAIMKLVAEHKAIKLEDLQAILSYKPHYYSHKLIKECAIDLVRNGELTTNRAYTIYAINVEEFNKFVNPAKKPDD